MNTAVRARGVRCGKVTVLFLGLMLLLCLGLTASSVVSPGQPAAAEAAQSADASRPLIANPAAVYCQMMGFAYTDDIRPSGQHGTCVLTKDTVCDAWGFLQGKCW